MSKLKFPFMVIIFIFGLIVLNSSFYTIEEGRQAVITQFGKPLKTVTEAGVHWKAPFIHDIRLLDLRILTWDGYPNQVTSKDKKYIKVDTTARWRIRDPLKFIQTVQNERGARSRLDNFLDGATRDVISSHNLVEAIRNSNKVYELVNEKKIKLAKRNSDDLGTGDDELTGEVEPIEVGREKLSVLILEKVKNELDALGIEIIDVQLRRITFEESVQSKVYSRMISERQSIAEKIRSIGKGEQAKIQGKTDRDLKKIESEAYRTIQKIKGEAEAKASKIYADSLNQDPEFYGFLRKLEAYEKNLPGATKLLLSTDSSFFDVLTKGKSK